MFRIQGIDCVGKSTVYNSVVDKLKTEGYDLFATKEPGDLYTGSCVGAGIRELLFKNPTTLKMRSGVADLLFLAEHLQNSGDALESVRKGKIVISDRYADSQFAYGLGKTNPSPAWTLELFARYYGLVPDLLILLKAIGPESNPDDISWIMGRGKNRDKSPYESGKQAGKTWSTLEDQKKIQNTYLKNLMGKEHVVVIPVEEKTTQKELFSILLANILSL